jgi:predicted esterase
MESEKPEIDEEDNEGFSGLEESSAQLNELLASECERVGAKNVVIAGFRQGGAMAVHSGLTFEGGVGSVCSLNGWVLGRDRGLLDQRAESRVWALNALDDRSLSIEYAEHCFASLGGGSRLDFRVDNTPASEMVSHEGLMFLAKIVTSVTT